MLQMEDKLEFKSENLNSGGQNNNGFNEEELILKLYDVGCFKFGTFKMRTGEESPVYVDLRVLWSYPALVVAVAELMWKKFAEVIEAYDMQLDSLGDYFVCGVPYQGIPFATYMSTHFGLRMLLKRQEAKKYGTGHILEGNYQKGDRVIMVDDVLMTGGTLVDDIPLLEREGLKVEFAVVFIDRLQGGKERVKQLSNKEVYSVLDLKRVFTVLLSSGKIDQETFDRTRLYLEQNRFDTPEYLAKML